MRQSRHTRPSTSPDLKVNGTKRAKATVGLFDRYRILPLNYMKALADPEGSYQGYSNSATALFRAGLLDRRSLNGFKNNYETLSYWRTEAGCTWLHGKGHEATYFTPIHDTHQSLVDLSEAQIELGARNSSIEYHSWLDIKSHPNTPPLPNKPLRFEHGSTHTTPDGRPFYLKGQNGSILFLREIDRNTEAPLTIITKLKHYEALEDQMKKRYGFKAMMLLFITTDETRRKNILKWIKEVFPQGCKWILVNAMEDHVKECRTTVPLTTHLFDTPYQRAGHPDFSLKTLS
jgi:hypothetical protein